MLFENMSILWCKNANIGINFFLLLTEKISVAIWDFVKAFVAIIHELHCGVNLYEKKNL